MVRRSVDTGTKQCRSCWETKPVEDFYTAKDVRPGKIKGIYLKSMCKLCDKKNTIIQVNKSKRKKRLFIWEYKKIHPCVDCGESNPICLQFDHVSGEKTMDVGIMAADSGSLKKLEIEISKCVIRCTNCHLKKTAKDQGWYTDIEKESEKPPAIRLGARRRILTNDINCTKTCGKCGQIKQFSEFYSYRDERNETGKGIYLQRLCKTCSMEVGAERATKNRIKKRIFIMEYKSTHPCIDCGETDITCLQFDHINDDKFKGVSQLVGSTYSIKILQKEVEKCVIRCGNCHMKKTAKEENWHKHELKIENLSIDEFNKLFTKK